MVVKDMTAVRRERGGDFNPVYHQYGPHRAGLPPLVNYFKELWHRREFAVEMSRATLRGANMNTFFGQAWLVINPLLLAGIYYLLVTIIRQKHDPSFFTHLTCSLFAFTLVQTAVTSGAKSVTASGKLVLNTAFPRLLMPLSAVRTAFFRFLPTIPVYLVLHIITGQPWSPKMLLSLYFLAMMVVFSMGLAAVFATLQVYFRDTTSFLPYFVRLWMYLSPVLWAPEMLNTMGRAVRVVVQINPMYSMLGGYTDLLQESRFPPTYMWVASAAWAVGFAVIGFLFFMSREREFAVRLV
jgi:ABC-type polysaccharide/polyol phosphate export permease